MLFIQPSIEMKKLPTKSVSMLCLALCSVNIAFSQTDEELSSLSLEELIEISVVSASKKSEGLQEAPSIIVTISSEEIADFGGNNLYEVLERATGFYGISSYIFPQNAIALRGDFPNHSNPNILFLINGRPFRESPKGGQNVGILTTFPLTSIKQIEIIRGPGSVLYGSNAFTGVVNVITKEYSEPEVTAFAGGGSFGTVQAMVNGGTSLGKLKISSGLQYFNQEGWDFADSTRVNGGVSQYGENKYGDNLIAGNLDLAYESFKLSGFYGYNEMGRLTGVFSEPDDYITERLFLDFGWQDTLIADVYSMSANVTYNHVNDDFVSTVVEDIAGNDWIFELTNYFKVNEKIDLLIGGSAYSQSGEQERRGIGFAIAPYTQEWYNAYTQFNYKTNEWLNFVAGGQINKVPNADADFVPRISAVTRFSSGFGTKLSYGEAFRAPYPGETVVMVPAVEGEPDLIPETVSTFEAQVSHFKNKGNVALTYFRSNSSDKITRIANPTLGGAPRIYANIGEVTSSGLELEGKYFFIGNSYLLGSYAYYTNQDENEEENVANIPAHSLKY